MRIRDIEIDEELASEIDMLLVQMDEYHVQVARAFFKTGGVSESVKLLTKIGATTHSNTKPTQANVKTALQNENVQLLLGLLRKAISRHTIRDGIWAEHQYAKVLERCMELGPVYDKTGEFTGIIAFDATNALRAVDGIVKLKGLAASDKQANKDGDSLAALAGILGRIDQSKASTDAGG